MKINCPRTTIILVVLGPRDLLSKSLAVKNHISCIYFSVGRCDAFGQVLEYLSVYNRDPVQFAIQYFHSRDVSYDQLRLLTKMCPKLTHVSLYVDEDAGNLLEPLNLLENLSEVKLLACNFYTDKVDQLLIGKDTH